METFTDKVRREWAAFAAMSFQQKLEHIWMYYKAWIAVGIILVAVAISAIGSIRYNSRQQLISGIFLNTATSTEGYAYLKDGYWEYRGGDNKQRAELIESRTLDMEALPESDAANLMVVVSMIAAKNLDYVVADEGALNLLDEQEVALDLREILDAQTLAGLTIKESATGVIAILLQDTAFGQTYPLAPEECWLVVINNTQNREETARFVQYLIGET